jgi:hypothetical protein
LGDCFCLFDQFYYDGRYERNIISILKVNEMKGVENILVT